MSSNLKVLQVIPKLGYGGAETGCYDIAHYLPEKIRYLMHNHVLREGNVGKLHYKENDLVIFNNRKVMHTSSPLEEYKEDRIFSLLFLATKTPIYNSSMAL